MAASNKSNEIRIIRVYDAPVQAVWDAWTDPEQVAQWWGPRGFTITTHSKDLRVGGTWRYTMHGPDGTDFPNTTKYFEVEKHARLVYDHGGSDDRPAMFRVTVTFAEVNGKTKMEMVMALPSAEALENTRKVIKNFSGNSTWDRLAEYLEKESTGKEKFVINRSFDASIETMFEMWTDLNRFSQWLPPTGFTMQFIRADIKPGGETFYFMTNGANVKMYGKAKYLKIERPNRIIYTQQFCDEHENMARHPMAPTWPETMLTTVVLAEEEPGKTRVTITWEAYGPTTPQELRDLYQCPGRNDARLTGSFDKLEGYLAGQP